MKNLKDIDSNDLITASLKNKRKYQEFLYKKYSSKMYAICKSYTDENETAKDILQDSFVKIFSGIDQYKERNLGSLEGWIRRIVTNTATDYYRRNIRLKKILDKQFRIQNRFSDSYENILDKITCDEIIPLIENLPKKSRKVYNLYVIQGFTHDEIAEKLKISSGTSKSQLNDARKRMQKLFHEMNISNN